MSATWRPVPGYPDYEVSACGRVRRSTPGRGTWPGRELGQYGGGGRLGNYLRVQLRRNGTTHTRNVHKLVAIAFHGDRREEGLHVDHIDSDAQHNAAANLRWIEPSENSRMGNAARWCPPPDTSYADW